VQRCCACGLVIADGAANVERVAVAVSASAITGIFTAFAIYPRFVSISAKLVSPTSGRPIWADVPWPVM